MLLAGSNGFLGAQIALRMLNNHDHTLYAMVRARDNEAAKLRLSRAWWDWPELVSAIGNRVIVLAGDVSVYQLGLSDKQYHDLVRLVTHIIHTAADMRLNGPIDQLRKTMYKEPKIYLNLPLQPRMTTVSLVFHMSQLLTWLAVEQEI